MKINSLGAYISVQYIDEICSLDLIPFKHIIKIIFMRTDNITFYQNACVVGGLSGAEMAKKLG